MFRRTLWAMIGSGLLATPCTGQAEWVWTEGSMLFPSTISQAQACAQAQDQARRDAIARQAGERIIAQQTEMCSELPGDTQCELHAALWTQLGGTIAHTRNISQETTVELGDIHRCTVRMEADVQPWHDHADPSFTLGFELSSSSLRQDDDLVLQVTPSQPMHVQLFQWQPGEAVVRLFPNSFQPDDYVTAPATVPALHAPYHLQARIPPQDTRPARDEYVIAIATRHPVAWRQSYRFEEFEDIIGSLSPTDSRIVRRSYLILRTH